MKKKEKETSKRKVFFSGMPKTGTKCMAKYCNFYTHNHRMPRDTNLKKNDNIITLMNVRNPLSYYVSVYNFKIKGGNEKIKDYGIMTNNSFEDFFNEKIKMKNLKRWIKPKSRNYSRFSKYEHKKIGFYTLSFIHWSFTDFAKVLDHDDVNEYLTKFFDSETTIKNHLRLENLQSEYDDFTDRYGLPSTSFQKTHSYPHDPYSEYYTEEMINEIYELDRFIFDRFYPNEINNKEASDHMVEND